MLRSSLIGKAPFPAGCCDTHRWRKVFHRSLAAFSRLIQSVSGPFFSGFPGTFIKTNDKTHGTVWAVEGRSAWESSSRAKLYPTRETRCKTVLLPLLFSMQGLTESQRYLAGYLLQAVPSPCRCFILNHPFPDAFKRFYGFQQLNWQFKPSLCGCLILHPGMLQIGSREIKNVF